MSERPGFFSRIKNNFTQYAAGTDDLSQLSETQQKLLRREAMGRLGASLYRNGDFGEAMQQQGEINAKRLEQMQAERQRAEVNAILNPNQGALVQPGGVAAPQAPRLLQTASTNAAPGQPRQLPAQQPAAAGGGAQQPPPQQPSPQQPSPQQAAGLARDASAQRARYEQLAQYYASQGNHQMTKQAIDMANAFAAREEYFAPIAAQLGGREVFIQGSKGGGVNVLDAAPMNTDTVRTAQQFGNDQEAFARHLAIKTAGADRSSTTVLGPDVAAGEMVGRDGARLDALRAEASQAVAALPSVQSAYEALRGQDTGALQNALIPLIRYVNPGADIVQAQTIAAAGMTPQLLAQLAGIGGSDTVREVELMLANLPSTANPAETNMKLFEVILAGTQRKIADAQAAEKLFYDQGGSLRGFVPQGNIQFDVFRRQFEQDNAAARRPAGTSRFFGLEEQ